MQAQNNFRQMEAQFLSSEPVLRPLKYAHWTALAAHPRLSWAPAWFPRRQVWRARVCPALLRTHPAGPRAVPAGGPPEPLPVGLGGKWACCLSAPPGSERGGPLTDPRVLTLGQRTDFPREKCDCRASGSVAAAGPRGQGLGAAALRSTP